MGLAMSEPGQKAILIAGPTASGKSALALRLARERGGVILNADSMQVYAELCLLTARPAPEEEALAPHRLYGHVAAREGYSVARWLEDVGRELDAAWARGLVPIVVGGTGLYFKALTEGLSPVPPVEAAVRARWRAFALTAPAGALHEALVRLDPSMAARLAPGDTQRLTRALEVVEGTGRSLAAWQSMAGTALVSSDATECLVVTRSRTELHRRADQRFDAMMAAGALDEVAGLKALGLDRNLPVMRALGVAPLLAHLDGEVDLDWAIERAKIETRQYIKRQETWLRCNMSSWKSVEMQ